MVTRRSARPRVGISQAYSLTRRRFFLLLLPPSPPFPRFSPRPFVSVFLTCTHPRTRARPRPRPRSGIESSLSGIEMLRAERWRGRGEARGIRAPGARDTSFSCLSDWIHAVTRARVCACTAGPRTRVQVSGQVGRIGVAGQQIEH